MSISEIIRDEANQKRAERLKEIGFKSNYVPQPQTMSMRELRELLSVGDIDLNFNNRYPQVVDIEEF